MAVISATYSRHFFSDWATCCWVGVTTAILPLEARAGTNPLSTLQGKISGTLEWNTGGKSPVHRNRISCAPWSSRVSMQRCSLGRIYRSAKTTELPSRRREIRT